jgi:hypothetical protein
MGSPAHRRAGGAGLARATLWAAIAVLALGGAAFSGCDIGGGDDDEPATTPATTEATGPTGPTGKNGDGGGDGGADGGTTDGGTTDGGTTDETPADTGPAVPESGGVGVDDYDPETDSPENDQPPPPGSPQEKFEQACDENPDLCD